MKFLTFLASFALCAVLSAGQYVGIATGTNNAMVTDKSDAGLKIGYHATLKYGYVFTSGIRSEAEVTYRMGKYKTIYHMDGVDNILSKEHNSVYSWAYMANVLYDIGNLKVFEVVPYLGIGVGYNMATEKNKIKFDDKTDEDKFKDSRFAYQGIIGAKYPIYDSVSIGMEYRYFVGRNHQKDHSVGVNMVKSF